MKRIAASLAMISVVAALVVGATWAVFTSTATVDNNTFATGTLEIRVNGSPSIAGFTFTNAAPGDMTTKVFTLQNYGAPHFAGPSTLPAKELAVSTVKESGNSNLYNTLVARLYANAGWTGCSNAGVVFVAGKGCEVYNGPLNGLYGMSADDILHATYWGAHPSLAAGSSLTMTLEVELPISAGNSLQGKSVTFDLVIDAYNPHR